MVGADMISGCSCINEIKINKFSFYEHNHRNVNIIINQNKKIKYRYITYKIIDRTNDYVIILLDIF